MIEELENGKIRIEPSDWRWSASIVGLNKYFSFLKTNLNLDTRIEINDEYIEFNPKDITEENYLLFVEEFFKENMHHLIIEELLEVDEWTEEQKKLISEKSKANTVMVKTLKDLNLSDRKKLKQTIDENRLEIIKQTYKGGKSLYANFCNNNNLFASKKSSCRVLGYSIDMGKKGKSTGFMRDKNSFVYTDSRYFDFIPFAFSKSREAFFINNNFTVDQLINTNKNDLIDKNRENTIRSDLFFRTKESSSFLDYDVEIIKKDRESEYFETIYLREEAIKIFENIGDQTQKSIRIKIKITDKYSRRIEKEVVDHIINLLKLDNTIEKLFVLKNRAKDNKIYKLVKEKYSCLIPSLIKINIIIYNKGDKMKEKQKEHIEEIERITKKIKYSKNLQDNKIRGYKKRLISAINLKDYERVQELLLHLSATTQIRMNFLTDVFTDFEENKNLVYIFINLLREKEEFKKTNREVK